MIKNEFDKHNAFLLQASDLLSVKNSLFDFDNFSRNKDTELYEYEYELFGINEARFFSLKLLETPFKSRIITTVFFGSITIEAQNALLKILEELPEKQKIILVTPNINQLLKTVMSRTYLLDFHLERTNKSNVFLSMNLKKRLQYIDKIMKGNNKLSEIEELLLSLELATQNMEDLNLKENIIKKIILLRKALHTQAHPLKPILESLAFVEILH